MILFIGILLLCSTHSINAAQFTFNTAVTCTIDNDGCQLTDPSIYIPQGLPGVNDSVVINVTQPTLLYLPPSAKFNVYLLQLQGNITLVVHENASILLHDVSMEDTTFEVMASGFFFIANSANITGSSLLFIQGSLAFAALNLPLVGTYFNLYENATLQGDGTGSITSFSRNHLFQGTIIISEQFTVELYGYALFDNTTLNVANIPYFGWATFQNVEATFPAGYNGYDAKLISSKLYIYKSLGEFFFDGFITDANSEVYLRSVDGFISAGINVVNPCGFGGVGTYIISSSNITAYLNNTLYKSTIILAGATNLVLSDSYFSGNQLQFANGEHNEAPYISITVQSLFVLEGDVEIPGELWLNSGSYNKISGNIAFTGTLLANAEYGIYTDIYGNVTFAGGIQLTTNYDPIFLPSLNYHYINLHDSTLYAPFILFGGNTTVLSNGTTVLIGNVVNNATIITTSQNKYVIQGNFTQTSQGIFYAINLTNTEDDIRYVNILVTDTAILSGILRYNTTSDPSSETKYVVLSANQTIGTFDSPVYLGDSDQFSSSLSYNSTSVAVVISPKTMKILGLDWYYWVAIGGGIVLIIIIAAIACTKMKNRHAYQKL